MTKVGTIDLFSRNRTSTGKIPYTSPNGAYELLVPDNSQTLHFSHHVEVSLYVEQRPDTQERLNDSTE